MGRKSLTLLWFALIGIVFFAIQAILWPDAVDYYYSFYHATDLWLDGRAVYERYDFVFVNPPWLILFLTPLQWMTYKGGQAMLNTFSFLVMILGWRWFAKSAQGYARPLSLAICIFNLHFFDLLLRGQIDGFVLLGTLFMYAALSRNNPYLLALGWLLAAIRPTSILLLWPYTLWWVYQRGYWRQVLSIILPVIGGSLIVFDTLWMWRWYHMMRFESPPQPGPWLVSWWRASEAIGLSGIFPFLIAATMLGISVWAICRYKPPLKMVFAFLTLTSLLITPYSLSYHYSVLMVIFIPILLQWRLWLGLPLFLLTLTPVLRAFWGVEVAWLDIFFALFAWGLSLLYMRKMTSQLEVVAAATKLEPFT